MTRSILSLVLLAISVFLSFKHGWDAFHPSNPQQAKMMAELGITKGLIPVTGILSFLIGLALLFPSTFFIGNVLNAVMILLIMALSLRSGNIQIALMEIPFLAMPLLLIWLKYPFKN